MLGLTLSLVVLRGINEGDTVKGTVCFIRRGVKKGRETYKTMACNLRLHRGSR